MGQHGFEPWSERPRRSRIDQATQLSHRVAVTVIMSSVKNILDYQCDTLFMHVE